MHCHRNRVIVIPEVGPMINSARKGKAEDVTRRFLGEWRITQR